MIALLALLAPPAVAALDCDKAPRYVVRSEASRDAYSFASLGSGASLSYEDRDFRGWDAQANTAYAHRFGLDDVDLGIGANRPFAWRHAYAGFELGGATRHVLLPEFRGSLKGALSLGLGFAAEGDAAYRHYDFANVYMLTPRLLYYWRNWVLVGGYTYSQTLYTAGGDSGGLSSYLAKALWTHCRFKPWLAYARSKEPFEAGRGVIQSFRADHYSAGAALRLAQNLEVSASLSYEKRLPSAQHVNGAAAGLSYSWGETTNPR